jgi:hypothetical protein
MKVAIAVLVVSMFVLVGCAATLVQLSEQGSKVEVGKRDPDPGMEEIGPVSATHGDGCGAFGTRGTYEGAYTLLKNEAARLGADFVQILTLTEPYHRNPNCFDNRFVIRGIAYRRR